MCGNFGAVCSDCEVACFGACGADVCAGESFCEVDDLLWFCDAGVHGAGVDGEDLFACVFVRDGDGNNPIKASGSQERGVEHVEAVGCCDDFDVGKVVESVDFGEELHQCALDFAFAGCAEFKAV